MSSNIEMYCDEHAPKPNPRLAKKDPSFFVGLFVKKGFLTDHPNVRVEHMWVEILRTENDKLIGEIDNEPVYCSQLKHRDVVTVSRSEIEAVFDHEANEQL